MDFDKPKVYGDTSITGGLVSTPTQLNLVLVVALVSWQMNGNDALIISSGTINSTVLLCCAATRGVIVMLQSSVINQAIYVHITPRQAPMCTNRGLCVPTYQYGRTNVTIENIPQTRPIKKLGLLYHL